jgi:hypothetical protein
MDTIREDAENSAADFSASQDFVSAYDMARTQHDWLDELSDEWISNPTGSEPSDQGSARAHSLRTFSQGRCETIPEEGEAATGTVRIVLGERDSNTPEWKRLLNEGKTMPRDLFSPCHLEQMFMDTPKSQKYQNHSLLFGGFVDLGRINRRVLFRRG